MNQGGVRLFVARAQTPGNGMKSAGVVFGSSDARLGQINPHVADDVRPLVHGEVDAQQVHRVEDGVDVVAAVLDKYKYEYNMIHENKDECI